MNAVLQVLWMVPAVRERYLSNPELIFMTSTSDPSDDFFTQMAKLGTALVEGKTGKTPAEDEDGKVDTDAWNVRPLSFKTLVGRGNVDFSSMHQQDSAHFLMHLLEIMDIAEKAADRRLPDTDVDLTSSMFSFQTEERLFCPESNRVRYKTAASSILRLDIPLNMATNKTAVDDYKEREMKRQRLKESGADAEIMIEPTKNGGQKVSEITKDDKEEKILPMVPFEACLSAYTGDVHLEDYFCQHLKHKTQAIKNTKLKSFPPFLMIQLNRYYFDETYVPKKMEVFVQPPEELHLESLRGLGHQPNEILQEETDEDKAADTGADPELVQQLAAMEFPENGCIKAAIAVNNQSLQSAIDWLLEHIDDPGLNDPIPKAADDLPDESSVKMLQELGFDEDSAVAALIKSNKNMDAAYEWLVTNASQLDLLVPTIISQQKLKMETPRFHDGQGDYELIGFISHMGSSTACGHYVCHIKKEKGWILFNDEKVALSESPPFDLGYMYLYKRKDIEGVSQ